MAQVIAISGSARRESLNSKLLAVAVTELREQGLDVEILDMREHVLPLFDEDLESELGVPQVVMGLKEKFRAARGFVFACPEYNSAITPMLKNTIDWCSRPVPGEPPLACFKGKAAGLVSASPGALGGLRGLYTVRSILQNVGSHVLPTMVAVGNAHEAFDGQGRLVDEGKAKLLKGMIQEYAGLVNGIGKVTT